VPELTLYQAYSSSASFLHPVEWLDQDECSLQKDFKELTTNVSHFQYYLFALGLARA